MQHPCLISTARNTSLTPPPSPSTSTDAHQPLTRGAVTKIKTQRIYCLVPPAAALLRLHFDC